MKLFYDIYIRAHVATATEKGKAFYEKIRTVAEEYDKMDFCPSFSCEDDQQGFTEIKLSLDGDFSFMDDSYLINIMQDINEIGNGSYGCLMILSGSGLECWETFGAAKFEEVPMDSSSLKGYWYTYGNFCISLEVPMEKILPIIPREAFEAAKAEYENDPNVSYATASALYDMFEEDCDKKVGLLTSEDLIDGLGRNRRERYPFFCIDNTWIKDNGLVNLKFIARTSDIKPDKFSAFKAAFEKCAKRYEVFGGGITFNAGSSYYYKYQAENVLINPFDLSVFMFESERNFISSGKVYQLRPDVV